MLSAAPQAYPAGTRIQVPTVSSRAADLCTFTIGDTETLDAAGPGACRGAGAPAGADYDQKAQVWLAEMDYLPVRIRITQTNGDYAELNLRAHRRRRPHRRAGGVHKGRSSWNATGSIAS
jgi:hypothetical protein